MFVDREESLARLESTATALAEGRSSVLFVEGDSGMGKSSLLGEFARRLGASPDSQEQPCRVVLVRAAPGIGSRRPYGPVLDALHALDRPAQGRRRLAVFRRTAARGALTAAPDLLSAAVPGLGAVVAAGRVFAEATRSHRVHPGRQSSARAEHRDPAADRRAAAAGARGSALAPDGGRHPAVRCVDPGVPAPVAAQDRG
ncbi:AAA family ATPase [Streptomyces sp. NPDC002814]